MPAPFVGPTLPQTPGAVPGAPVAAPAAPSPAPGSYSGINALLAKSRLPATPGATPSVPAPVPPAQAVLSPQQKSQKLLGSITSARQANVPDDDILTQISKQNDGLPIAQSITAAKAAGVQSTDALNEIIKQNTPPPPPGPAAPAQAAGLREKGMTASQGFFNTLFPFATDVANDISNTGVVKGTTNAIAGLFGKHLINEQPGGQTKSGLQQTGDAILTGANFLPGLDLAGPEVDSAVTATNAANKAGLLSTIAQKVAQYGPDVAKGLGLGYTLGTASDLSKGQSIAQAVKPNPSNVISAGISGGIPLLSDVLNAARGSISGIPKQIQTALTDSGITVDDYDQFMNAAKAHATNVRAPDPLALAANKVDQATGLIDQQIAKAGQAVGAAKATLGGVAMPDLTEVLKNLQTDVAEKYGIGLTLNPQTAEPVLRQLPDRSIPISSSEISRIKAAAQSIIALQGSTALNATDVINGIDSSINYAKAASGLHPYDPIESTLLKVRGGINDAVRTVAPDLASANDAYSTLANMHKEITGMAGGQNQRAELLMKRVFSGDKSADVQNVFNQIKQATGIDLVNTAVLAKHAIDTYGDPSQKTDLAGVLGNVAKDNNSLPMKILSGLGHFAQKIIANPEAVGRNIVGGAEGAIKTLPSSVTSQAAQRTAQVVSSKAAGGLLATPPPVPLPPNNSP